MAQAAVASLAASFRASMASTEFSSAFSKTLLPMVLSTKPSTRPLRFFAVGLTGEGVGVAGRASPHVGVGCCQNDAVGIGPIVVQAFPDTARAFGDERFSDEKKGGGDQNYADVQQNDEVSASGYAAVALFGGRRLLPVLINAQPPDL
jgi:hypothetical protein